MFSYRHAYHAGNHADILKHVVLCQCIDYLQQKDTALRLIDTHAGAGCYDLSSPMMNKVGEYRDGIQRLWNAPKQTELSEVPELPALPALITDFLRRLQPLQKGKALSRYPGSPWFMAQALRPQDQLKLYEMHPTDHKLLVENLRLALPADNKSKALYHIEQRDGFNGLKASLPPPSRRALALIDPAYEVPRDYELVVTAIADALKRLANGVYMVWYPVIGKREAHLLPERLMKLAPNWLDVRLIVREAPRDGFGLYGSGMFVCNPPWVLANNLKEILPALSARLAQDAHARFSVTTSDK